MPDMTRRSLVGATSVGIASLGLIGEARAAEPDLREPRALLGKVEDGRVSLPPLDNAADLSVPAPNLDPPGKRLGVAVVGIGHLTLGQILPGFGEAKHVRLTALVSGERDKALAVAAQHGVAEKNIYDYQNFDSLKNNPDVDIIYIVLPNALHAEYTVRAAQAGKHVLCEKPMASNVADAQRMVDACRAAGRKLMIAYRCQYLPEHRAIIDMARARQFGDVRLIEAVNGQNNANNGQWRHIRAMSGGGSLPDVGLYCLNATRYITGEEPVEVSARLTQPKDDPRFREVEDVVSFTLRFPSGVLASCQSGYSFHEQRALRVMAADGWFGLDPAFSYNNLVLQAGRRAGMANGEETRRWAPRNHFANEMDAFAEALRVGREPLTPGEEGLQDMRVMQAIYEAASGGGVVKMQPAARLDSTRGPVPSEA
jgi:predicted dehydrogenase